MRNICEYCGTNLDVEREVFGGNDRFEHSCQGTCMVKDLAEKRALDHFQSPLDKLNELSREWCLFQAQKDLEVSNARNR